MSWFRDRCLVPGQTHSGRPFLRRVCRRPTNADVARSFPSTQQGESHASILTSRRRRARAPRPEAPVTGIDLASSLALLASVLAIALAYGVRWTLAGPARFERVEAAGASPLLGRGLMEMGYWALQPVARAAERAGICANTITAVSLALGAAAGVALAFGHLGVAAVATVASSLGDVLDGMIARRTGTTSKSGAIFDAAADRYDEFFFLAGLGCLYHEDLGRLGLVLLALLGSFMVSYGSAKADALGVKPPRGAMRRAERAVYLAAGALLSPIAAALAERLALPAWVAQAPMLATLALVGVVANVSAVRRLEAVMRAVAPERTVRELAPLEAPGAPLSRRPVEG